MYILVTDIREKFIARSKQVDLTTVDSNVALRGELLTIATAGIRSSTRTASTCKPNRKKVSRRPPKTVTSSSSRDITFWFFFEFMFNYDKSMEEKLKGIIANSVTTVQFSRQKSNSFSSQTNPMAPPRLDCVNVGVSAADNERRNRDSERGSDASSVHESLADRSVRESDMMEIHTREDYDMDTVLDHPSDFHLEIEEQDNDSEAGTQITATTSSSEKTKDDLGILGRLKNYYSRILYSCRVPLFSFSDYVEFSEYCPYYFRQIRLASGISDDMFISYFNSTVKERLTEGGASGAFFFFSKDEKFIAKSCTIEEMEIIRDNAEALSQYLVKNPTSYISEIYGAYRLQVYGNVICFFVMRNIFENPEGLVMNEKYDIKGSWVARNASLPQEGQSATCM